MRSFCGRIVTRSDGSSRSPRPPSHSLSEGQLSTPWSIGVPCRLRRRVTKGSPVVRRRRKGGRIVSSVVGTEPPVGAISARADRHGGSIRPTRVRHSGPMPGVPRSDDLLLSTLSTIRSRYGRHHEPGSTPSPHCPSHPALEAGHEDTVAAAGPRESTGQISVRRNRGRAVGNRPHRGCGSGRRGALFTWCQRTHADPDDHRGGGRRLHRG